MEERNVEERLRRLFADAFQMDPPCPDVDLVDNGILDSFQFVELLFRLEKEFDLRVALENVDLDDLRTLERISSAITTEKLATARTAASPSPES